MTATGGAPACKRGVRCIHNYVYLSLVVLAYALAASSTEHSFLQKWRTLNSPTYSFQQFMDYKVPRPYAYRVLMPALVNLLSRSEVIGRVTHDQALISRAAVLYDRDHSVEGWSLDLQAKYVLTGFLMFVSLLLAMFSLRKITFDLFPARALADASPLLFAMFLPLTFRGDGGFMYDFTELGLYCLGLHFLFRGDNYKFLILIPIIILNKEAGLLILPLSAIILFSTMNKKSAFVQLANQSLVAIVAYLLIRSLFSGNPGSVAEFHLWGNLQFWSDIRNYLAMMSTSTFFIPVPKPNNILLLALFALVILYRWKEKPLLLRRLLLAASAINLPLFIVFCYRDEFRNLALMYPFLHLLMCHSIMLHYEQPAAAAKEAVKVRS
jgi:hypothetical protein